MANWKNQDASSSAQEYLSGRREAGKEAIERQRAAISALSGEIDCLRGSIQEGKFVAGESEKDVESWSEDIGTNLVTADEHVGSLTKFLKEIETETRDLERDQNHAKFCFCSNFVLDPLML